MRVAPCGWVDALRARSARRRPRRPLGRRSDAATPRGLVAFIDTARSVDGPRSIKSRSAAQLEAASCRRMDCVGRGDLGRVRLCLAIRETCRCPLTIGMSNSLTPGSRDPACIVRGAGRDGSVVAGPVPIDELLRGARPTTRGSLRAGVCLDEPEPDRVVIDGGSSCPPLVRAKSREAHTTRHGVLLPSVVGTPASARPAKPRPLSHAKRSVRTVSARR